MCSVKAGFSAQDDPISSHSHGRLLQDLTPSIGDLSISQPASETLSAESVPLVNQYLSAFGEASLTLSITSCLGIERVLGASCIRSLFVFFLLDFLFPIVYDFLF